ncbi:MAG: UvrD-helicase domain-containing protein, partial [Pseudomonadota bacterium]
MSPNPSAHPPLNPALVPLSGVNLVEASAGTGKTHALTSLYLRLVAEKGLAPENILVVTFTKAATRELVERIRSRLREAARAYRGEETADSFIRDLARDLPDGAGPVAAALRNFDQAAVFTIHAFCQRVLTENAFESGAAFGAALCPDPEEYLAELAEDWFRRRLYNAAPLVLGHALANKRNPDHFLHLARLLDRHPEIKVLGPKSAPDPAGALADFEAVLARVKALWGADRDAIWELLENAALHGTYYGVAGAGRQEKLGELFGFMDDFCVLNAPEARFLFKGLEKFTSPFIQNKKSKGSTPPSHDFFDACEELSDAAERVGQALDLFLAALDAEFFPWAAARLAEKKAREGVLFYSDLIHELSRAMAGPRGPALVESAGARYQAALIDEFQDTDPAQWAIFRALFADRDKALFLIGDPKQAIYSFRGADVFSYLLAAQSAGATWTLSENWRSGPALIRAVNRLFDRGPRPFVLSGIGFSPAAPAPVEDRKTLLVDGKPPSPLSFWFIEPKVDSKGKLAALSQDEARRACVNAAASEAARLVGLSRQGRASLGDRPLAEGDIAVLVRTNQEAQEVQDRLREAGVHAVLRSTASLFDSPEAGEVHRLLTAVARPGPRTLRAALATSLFGRSGAEIFALGENQEAWEQELTRFRGWLSLWISAGFIRMFRTLLLEAGVRERLAALADGERRLTNVLHLAETLHTAEAAGGRGPEALVDWLFRCMAGPGGGNRPDEHQVRLESDEEAVQVVTMHRSKGLQYPVVICPFTWKGASKGKTREGWPKEKPPHLFHDPENGFALSLDVVGDERHLRLRETEALAENVRLLYVALTRAKHTCCTAWGAVSGAETSAPAWLLFPPDSETESALVEELGERLKKTLAGPEPERALKKLAFASDGDVALADLPRSIPRPPPPSALEAENLAARAFPGRVDQEWGVASFSSLTADRHGEEAPRAEPGADEEGPDFLSGSLGESPAPDMFSFPRGPLPGLALHQILEQVDFADPGPNLPALCAESLAAHGIGPDWAAVAADMVR